MPKFFFSHFHSIFYTSDAQPDSYGGFVLERMLWWVDTMDFNLLTRLIIVHHLMVHYLSVFYSAISVLPQYSYGFYPRSSNQILVFLIRIVVPHWAKTVNHGSFPPSESCITLVVRLDGVFLHMMVEGFLGQPLNRVSNILSMLNGLGGWNYRSEWRGESDTLQSF